MSETSHSPEEAATPGETYYVEHGWSGCDGSSWARLSQATRDGWEAAAREHQRLLPPAEPLSIPHCQVTHTGPECDGPCHYLADEVTLRTVEVGLAPESWQFDVIQRHFGISTPPGRPTL